MNAGAIRIGYLDGLRGVAVLAVMAWHYTNRGYEKYLPYGMAYAAIPVLDHGWIGVNLFFLISGMVILMTLERCATFGEFFLRRWSRLFPAMLIASIIVFAASLLLSRHMPHGAAEPVDLLPGLTFIIPTFWELVLQRPVSELDGVYWTLYVEMGFYVVFGTLFFKLGWRKGLAGLTAVWLATVVLSRLGVAIGSPALALAVTPMQWIGAEYYGWFVAGALFYKASQHASTRLFALAVGAGLISALTSDLWQPGDIVSRAYLCGCVLFFAATQSSARLRHLLDTRLLLFLGAISYPLYLLHNELGIGLIGWLGTVLPERWWPIIPLPVMGAMIMVAWLIARFIEPSATARLRRTLIRDHAGRDSSDAYWPEARP